MSNRYTLNFDNLFSKNAPKPKSADVPKRGKYDFAVAYPDPESLPLEELTESLRQALSEEGADLAIYPHPQGYPPLREYVADRLARDRNMMVSSDDIILATGSSQPIHMVTEALVEPGDVVITEDFVYGGTLTTLHRFRADIRGVECDFDGMLPESLERTIRTAISEDKKPKMIYTIPVFQNPQGWTMSLERRLELLRLSREYGVPVLEDDCYVDLRFDNANIPSIHSLDEDGRVMYVASFSKIIAPGMRLGYLTAPSSVMDRARAIKSGGGANQFTSLAIHRFATSGGLDNHVAKANESLKSKRDAMVAALGENFGSAATWNRPKGGLYVWLKMSDGVDLVSTQPKALLADVGYHPGSTFAPDGISGKHFARLCFGYNKPEEIHEGISRLAEVLSQEGIL